ncbi:fibroblast growth factor receptor 4-like [Contarinia nasturtii]|uniref:fibroblast growth factor receptor 4-like n=1 Tax=Contarinia nasturtii TaxID=265458 RepID=UPI0012D3D709|nr:fibroblast growth factor receptor 4-like [Contarinia nasturtii]
MGRRISIMFASTNFFALVLLFLPIDADVTINQVNHGIPKENENITITCKSDECIDWISPWEKFPSLKYAVHEWNGAESFLYMHSAKLIDRRYNVTYSNESDKSFVATLHLYNVTHESVGFYFCAKKSFQFRKPLDLLPQAPNEEGGISDVTTNVARIYVEVKVTDNAPLINRRIDMFEEDGCTVSIPCLGQNREQTTKLVLTENGNERNINPTSLSDDYPQRYEQKYWELGSKNNFTCLVNEKKQSEIDFHLHRMTEPFNRSDEYVEIFSKTNADFVEGDQIELTCLYKNKTKDTRAVDVQWILPNNNLAEQEGRVEQSDTCNFQGNKKIIVKNATANDIGTYKCIVEFRNDYAKFTKVKATINITNIYDADKPLLTVPPGMMSVRSNLNTAEELLFMRYVAKDGTKFWIEYENIFNDTNGTIEIEDESNFAINMSKKFQAVNIRGRRLIILMIRNLSFSDNANYTVIAKNGNKTTNETIKLVVQGKPIVGKIETNDQGNITGKCDVIAYPRPSKVYVTLMTVDGLPLATQSFNETNIQQSYEFGFEPRKVKRKSMVKIRCDATNEIGTHSRMVNLEKGVTTLTIIVVSSSVLFFLAFVASLLLSVKKCIFNPRKENIPIDKFIIVKKLRLLGAGGFGEVHQAIVGIYDPLSKTYKNIVAAIKTLHTNFQGIDQMLNELNTVMRLEEHENVVRFIGAITKNIMNGDLVIIFEYCEGQNLQEFLSGTKSPVVYIDQIERTCDGYRINQAITETAYSITRQAYNPKKYSTTDLLNWASQTANGLHFLAKNGISHCDLAARNLILCNDNTIKICDFGMALEMPDGRVYQTFDRRTLASRWMAPEVLRHRVFNEKSDVWGFGLVMWEMFTAGARPFPDIDDGEFTPENILREVKKMEKPDEMTPKIFDIIKWCLEEKEYDRPTFVELVKRIRMALYEEPDSSSDDDENRPIRNEATGETTGSHQVSDSMDSVLSSSNSSTITMPDENPSFNQPYGYLTMSMPDRNSSTLNHISNYIEMNENSSTSKPPIIHQYIPI